MKTTALLFVSVFLCSLSYGQDFFLNDLQKKGLMGRVKKVREKVFSLSGDTTKGRCWLNSSESYNEQGFVIEKSDYNPSTNVINYRLTYKYDINNNKTEVVSYIQDTFYKRIIYVYDDKGSLLQEVEYYAGLSEPVVYNYGGTNRLSRMNCKSDKKFVRSKKSGYDKAGNWTEENGSSEITVREIEYYRHSAVDHK